MPIYTYQCKSCGVEVDQIREIRNREKVDSCACGGEMQKILSPMRKHPDHLYPYIDEYMAAEPIEIRSRSHRLQELKKRGKQEIGVGVGMPGRWI